MTPLFDMILSRGFQAAAAKDQFALVAPNHDFDEVWAKAERIAQGSRHDLGTVDVFAVVLRAIMCGDSVDEALGFARVGVTLNLVTGPATAAQWSQCRAVRKLGADEFRAMRDGEPWNP